MGALIYSIFISKSIKKYQGFRIYTYEIASLIFRCQLGRRLRVELDSQSLMFMEAGSSDSRIIEKIIPNTELNISKAVCYYRELYNTTTETIKSYANHKSGSRPGEKFKHYHLHFSYSPSPYQNRNSLPIT